jgi:hypothetical protein
MQDCACPVWLGCRNPAQVAQSDNDTLVAYVIPADKQRVPVAIHNVFVGQVRRREVTFKVA